MKVSQWISHKHAFAHMQTLDNIYAGEHINLTMQKVKTERVMT